MTTHVNHSIFRLHPGVLLWALLTAADARAAEAPAFPSATNSAISQVGTNVSASASTNTPSRFRSPDDGWFDMSGFLGERYGFLPLMIPITEPAVGYGAAAGMTFLSEPMAKAKAGYGRPDITAIGGFGTQNGSWGVLAGDVRHWLDDRLQTLVGVAYASINLDFYGIGDNSLLAGQPLSYNLNPKGALFQGKYRLGNTRAWAGLGYALAETRVSFDAPPGTPGLPAFQRDSTVGGLIPSLTYDTRDNIFTPLRGTYLEVSTGLFSEALGGDEAFQRVRLGVMQYVPLGSRLFLGLRGDASATFGGAPFYLQPFVSLRGAPAMRYQGEEVAQLEAELRWQFWKRFSLVGFTGVGVAWNDFNRFKSTQTVVTGGAGFRYELARKYGVHAGLDVAFGPDNTAIYIQVGSAWARP